MSRRSWWKPPSNPQQFSPLNKFFGTGQLYKSGKCVFVPPFYIAPFEWAAFQFCAHLTQVNSFEPLTFSICQPIHATLHWLRSNYSDGTCCLFHRIHVYWILYTHTKIPHPNNNSRKVCPFALAPDTSDTQLENHSEIQLRCMLVATGNFTEMGNWFSGLLFDFHGIANIRICVHFYYHCLQFDVFFFLPWRNNSLNTKQAVFIHSFHVPLYYSL